MGDHQRIPTVVCTFAFSFLTFVVAVGMVETVGFGVSVDDDIVEGDVAKKRVFGERMMERLFQAFTLCR